jgi:hypothetical protein
MKGPEGEQKYSSTLSLTSALDKGGWLMPRLGRFTPLEDTRYAMYLTWIAKRNKKCSLSFRFTLQKFMGMTVRFSSKLAVCA